MVCLSCPRGETPPESSDVREKGELEGRTGLPLVSPVLLLLRLGYVLFFIPPSLLICSKLMDFGFFFYLTSKPAGYG